MRLGFLDRSPLSLPNPEFFLLQGSVEHYEFGVKIQDLVLQVRENLKHLLKLEVNPDSSDRNPVIGSSLAGFDLSQG